MDREGGFIVIHRRVRSSPLYRSLTAEQRSVFLSILLLANWKPGAILVGDQWHTVHRGELAHSIETIAGEAAVSVKVVRTTLSKFFADDKPAGGRGPFLTERWAGTNEGRPRRILTVVNYDTYQSLADDEDTPAGTTSGSVKVGTGARDGHDRGTTGAPIEPWEPREPVEPPAGRDRRARVGIGCAEGEAVAHWQTVAWPRLSSDSCPDPSERDVNRLRALCRSPGLAAVKAAMDRATSDPWWSQPGKLDLPSFLTNFGKFTARKAAAPPGPPRVIAGNATWDGVPPEDLDMERLCR